TVQKETAFDSYDSEATDQMKHVEMFTSNLGTFIGHLQTATEQVADDIGDPFTEDLLIEVARNLSLRLYFLESHLQT
ncbi:MAG: hypothetical protein ACOCX1_05360, partial [Fimbriimonadaceae bacterium]